MSALQGQSQQGILVDVPGYIIGITISAESLHIFVGLHETIVCADPNHRLRIYGERQGSQTAVATDNHLALNMKAEQEAFRCVLLDTQGNAHMATDDFVLLNGFEEIICQLLLECLALLRGLP